jgi:2-amino-4-hydroxy-6-hydroxymethyldihydropteridine diphosphokinase
LLLGSNLGAREVMLKKAALQIRQHIGHILNQSSFYETEPWGFAGEDYFLNQVIIAETSATPSEILETVILIENSLGRKRSENRYASRSIDIDILFFDNQVIHEKNLIVPHQELHKRLFALIPLAEVAPDLVHPVFNKPISVLLNECGDRLKVSKVE